MKKIKLKCIRHLSVVLHKMSMKCHVHCQGNVKAGMLKWNSMTNGMVNGMAKISLHKNPTETTR